MRDAGDLRDVQDLEAGIADRLAEQEAGLGPDRRGEGLRIARVDEGRLDAEARQGELQQVGAAAVERLGRDDVAAGAHQGRDREVQRRLTARRRDRADPALERGDALLEHRRGRVRDARVDVPGALEVEERRRLIGIGEHVGGGLVDRHRAGAGRRVRPLAGVQRERVGSKKLWVHEVSPPAQSVPPSPSRIGRPKHGRAPSPRAAGTGRFPSCSSMAFRSSLWHNGSGNYGARVLFTPRNRLAEAIGMRSRLITLLVCAVLSAPCLAGEAEPLWLSLRRSARGDRDRHARGVPRRSAGGGADRDQGDPGVPGPRRAGDLLVHRQPALHAREAAGDGAARVHRAGDRRQLRCQQEPDPAGRAVPGRHARGLAPVTLAPELHRQRIGLAAAGPAARGCRGPVSGDGADPPPDRGRDRRLRMASGRLQPGRHPGGFRRQAGRRAALASGSGRCS